LLTVTCTVTTSWATTLTAAGGTVTWTPYTLGGSAHKVFTNNAVTQATFIGQINSTGAANQTVAFNTGTPALRIGWQEFSTTAGFASITLDNFGTIDQLSSGIFPSITPAAAGRTYWSFGYDNGTGVAGSTSGYTYAVDGVNGNLQAYNTNCAGSAQQPNIGDTATDGLSAIAIVVYENVPASSGVPIVSPSAAAMRAASW